MKKSKDNFLDYQMWRLEKDFERMATMEALKNNREDIDMNNKNIKLWNKLRDENKKNNF